MSPITQWNPATKISRGNVKVGIAASVVDINAPLLSELTTGVGLDCAIQDFNGTSSTDMQTLDWLCNPVSEQIPGSLTHTIDDILIKVTGQEDSALLAGLSVGTTVFIWRRDGIGHDVEPAEGQFVWVWECVITSIDPAPANNTFIGITAHVSVKNRSAMPVAIVD